jgi:uncharacterized protein YdhG (YjbR/CyaY superfamily)
MAKAQTVEDYFKALPEERRGQMEALRDTIRANLPGGFEEVLNYGQPSWVVPHSLYEAGYHVNPDLPLPFLSIASQKSHIGVYHMGIYASSSLMDWFVGEYPKHCKTRLDMGKSCIRFKKAAELPHDLIGELCGKMSAREWIQLYEEQVRSG